MKQRFLFLNVCLILLSLYSCKDGGLNRKSMLPAVTGGTNELLVITPKARWEGAIGDTVRAFFGQAQPGLPQGEPMFDMLNLPYSNFEKSVQAHRNVLIISLKSSADSASITYSDSPWARTQKVFRIVAPTAEAFYDIFRENREQMMGVFLKAERERLMEVYKKNPDRKIFDRFKDKYDMLLYCPGGYRINKDTADFTWVSMETKADSRGFIFFQEPYTHESQLNYRIILERVNEELEKHIPGPLDSTWMGLDLVTPITAANYEYNGKHYAFLFRGLWLVVNDYMGGPFVLNTVLDEKNNRVLYMMGYVYAPESKKRNLLRQVESIIFSMDVDYEK